MPADPAKFRYRRLPGRTPLLRWVLGGSTRLWLGDDHLLQLQTVNHFSEVYKRFAYGDIQALLLRETMRGVVTTLILALLAAACGGMAWGMKEAVPRGVFIGIGAFFLVLFLVYLIRGKTCCCHVQTAVGPHPLPSLSRVRPARKALRLITEKVEEAQGGTLSFEGGR